MLSSKKVERKIINISLMLDTIKIDDIAARKRHENRNTVQKYHRPPHLLGIRKNHANDGVRLYSEWTGRTLKQDGFSFDLEIVDDPDFETLKARIGRANTDPTVDGIIVYYPIFGDWRDDEVKHWVDPKKDAEGLTKNSTMEPCTPLAILHIVDEIAPHAQHVTIINRSLVLGHPLARLLAASGKFVYSVDINDTRVVSNDLDFELVDIPLHVATRKSEVIVIGVPPPYHLPIDHLPQAKKTMIINVSGHHSAVDHDILMRADDYHVEYVRAVGKLTIAMLEMNLLNLYNREKN